MSDREENEVPGVRVLVVDDQRLMRDGIASLLSIQPGITLVGTAAHGQEAIELAGAVQPDVVLMDVRMPIMDGVVATAEIRRQLPTCQVLMLTTFDDDEYIVAALQAGACGYLLKDIPAPDLAQAVHAAHKGIFQLDRTVAGRVVGSLAEGSRHGGGVPTSQLASERAPQAKVADLTSREVEVLRLLSLGATNREIANELILSEGTVKNHISNILSRLGLRDRTQAALYAREIGLL